MITLRNRIAVVTGASSGIGAAIAVLLAEQGMRLILVGREIARLRETADRCAYLASGVKYYIVNLLRGDQIRHFCRNTLDEYEGVDLVVHCAADIALGPFADAKLEDFDRLYRCNLRAPFEMTRLFLPSLIERQGQVVFANSTSGLDAKRNQCMYAATKHALKALAESLRDEVNPAGVRVLSIYLGRTATPMQESIHQIEHKVYRPDQLIQPEHAAKAIVNALMMDRDAEITEIRMRPLQKPLSEIDHDHGDIIQQDLRSDSSHRVVR